MKSEMKRALKDAFEAPEPKHKKECSALNLFMIPLKTCLNFMPHSKVFGF